MSITKTEIIGLEKKLVEGIKKSDISFLDKVLHNDLLFMMPDGQIITKAIDLASHSSGEMVVEQLLPTIENIKIIDDTAIVIVVYDTKGILLGNAIQGLFRYIRVWKQFPD